MDNKLAFKEFSAIEAADSGFSDSTIRSTPPINVEQLQLAVSFAHGLVIDNASSLAMSMQEVGDVALPDLNIDGNSAARDYSALKTLSPLYLAFELEQAGVLKTAERISGLFFSGAITQPLGEAESLIREFWQNRRQRLNRQERESLFQQTFEYRYFYPQFSRLCQAIVALADNTHRDIQEEVQLDFALQNLREYLFSRSFGMVTYVAEDILSAITSALTFLKQPHVLGAFHVRSLWELLSVSTSENQYKIRQYAEMASAGMYLINWVSSPQAGQLQLQNKDISQRIFSAAHRWLLAFSALESIQHKSLGQNSRNQLGATPFSTSTFESTEYESVTYSRAARDQANSQMLSSWIS
ncbi:hypothetical protein [Aliikangiella sp. G2MR2-5]|uniref:hypothetical protein n=1 Tax=Aliikangiella sp. G2MR2-5 TaxID=2788943 RepID=UPI0018ABBD68|nr:hypothetical protein [Aliikangiella sp. G2MR2-5]